MFDLLPALQTGAVLPIESTPPGLIHNTAPAFQAHEAGKTVISLDYTVEIGDPNYPPKK